MTLQETMRGMGEAAREAARRMATVSTRRKNIALRAMAAAVDTRRDLIKAANERDFKAGRQAGLRRPCWTAWPWRRADRTASSAAFREVADLPDPVGRCISRAAGRTAGHPQAARADRCHRHHLRIASQRHRRRRRPLPQGRQRGDPPRRTRGAPVEPGHRRGAGQRRRRGPVCRHRSCSCSRPPTARRSRARADARPHRPGDPARRRIADPRRRRQARVPVIKHYKGVCHVFVDESADPDMALAIIENAKCQRPGVCNALETLLVHANLAATFLAACGGIRPPPPGRDPRRRDGRAVVPTSSPSRRPTGQRVPRSDPVRARRRRCRRGHRPHQLLRLPPLRRHRHA